MPTVVVAVGAAAFPRALALVIITTPALLSIVTRPE